MFLTFSVFFLPFPFSFLPFLPLPSPASSFGLSFSFQQFEVIFSPCPILLTFYGLSSLIHSICVEYLFPYITVGSLSFQVMLKAGEVNPWEAFLF